MATKDQEVALLTYRYNQLDKAIENAAKWDLQTALLYTQWLL
jgi:trehalose/maltose hydrolase-like predicted phosphorylase